MAKYLLSYHGGGGMEADAEAQAKTMAAWGVWFGQLGSGLVDGGNPTSQTSRITPDGRVTADPNGPSGYSIIAADSLDAAVQLAKGCPVLASGGTVQVSETIDVM